MPGYGIPKNVNKSLEQIEIIWNQPNKNERKK